MQPSSPLILLNNSHILSCRTDNYDIYLSYYERLLDNYIKNIDFIKEYQNFKKLNNICL